MTLRMMMMEKEASDGDDCDVYTDMQLMCDKEKGKIRIDREAIRV